MMSTIEVPLSGFFRRDKADLALHHLAHECLAGRGVLTVEFGPAAATLSLEQSDESDNGIVISGAWRTPGLFAVPPAETGVKLLVPLLYRVSCLRLPHGQIFALARHDRPIVDFFARNLFLAMARNAPLDCHEMAGDAVRTSAAKDFQRHYFFVFKHVFPTPAFAKLNASDSLDLVAVDSYLPVLTYESQLLRCGAEKIRNARAHPPVNLAELKTRVVEARESILALYAA